MTIKERIESEARRTALRYDPSASRYSAGKQVGHIRGFIEGAEYALNNQWISVDEAIPQSNEEVLCLMKSNGAVVSGFIFKEGNACKVATRPDFEFEDYLDYQVEAWMPMPEYRKEARP
ncbi:MAG TPA: DUF551 domain-containing protein [Candidatus Bacteroides pullicola]|uniref:DUF551 domain-containing protein n=1 Tax=Candidatus Bacteroides pullicola TaxID=2838475 RepID=A0A9D1ZGZ6_9BACE|nr:DUF551 domain-containing protein [Candidatus Bacteroides pullicola]